MFYVQIDIFERQNKKNKITGNLVQLLPFTLVSPKF